MFVALIRSRVFLRSELETSGRLVMRILRENHECSFCYLERVTVVWIVTSATIVNKEREERETRGENREAYTWFVIRSDSRVINYPFGRLLISIN